MNAKKDVKRITATELVERCRQQGMHYPLAVGSELIKRAERLQETKLQQYEENLNGKA